MSSWLQLSANNYATITAGRGRAVDVALNWDVGRIVQGKGYIREC